MIDPVSAYAAATTAYKGVKMLLQAGRELYSCKFGQFGHVQSPTRHSYVRLAPLIGASMQELAPG